MSNRPSKAALDQSISGAVNEVPGDGRSDRRFVSQLIADAIFLMHQRDWIRAIRRLTLAWEHSRNLGDQLLVSRSCLKLSEAYGACGLDYLSRRFLQHAMTAEMSTWQEAVAPVTAIEAALQTMRQEAQCRDRAPRSRVFDPEWN